MASVFAEYPTTLLHLVDSSSTAVSRPRRRRRFDLEFKASAGKKSSPTASAFLHWLTDLSTQQKMQLFSLENPWLSSMLRQMFARKLREGEGSFTVIANPRRVESDLLDDYFSYSKSDGEYVSGNNEERELEQQLRFCDTNQYLDTVALSSEFLQDFDRCLHIAAQVTHGAAFQTPCLVLWDSSVKAWVWQCPPWVLGTMVGLSGVALAAFEKNCWARFFEAAGRDPRAPGETQGFTWDTFPPDSSVNQISNLTTFWKSLNKVKKSEIVGNSATLTNLFQLGKKTYQELQKRRGDAGCATLFQTSSYSTNGKFVALYTNSGQYYSACRTRMQHYLSQRSVDLVIKMLDEGEEEYIEFILMSPLERTTSIFDIVARKTAEKIKEALRAQIAEDLLQSEDTAPVRKQKTKAKKKRSKAKSNTPSAVSEPVVPPPQDTDSEKKEIAENILELIYSQALAEITKIESSELQLENAEFQTVQPNRKKAEKPLKTTEPFVSWHRGKRQKAVSKPVPVNSVPARPNAPVVIQWADQTSEKPSIKFEPAMDFPPLPMPVSVVSFDSLSSEIHQFKSQILSHMIFRRKTMINLLHKMQEVVCFLFPGAFVNIFGSYATRLALPISDLDLAVVNAGFGREEIAQAVGSLADVLPVYKWAVHVQSITTASVPVVKLTVDPHYFGGELNDYVKVDITFEDNTDMLEGRHIGMASCQWVQQLLEEFPHAQECILALKNLLYLQQLNSAYLGGLSSYSLVLWVGAYLRTYPTKTSGELLMGILHYYGSEFNPRKTGVGPGSEGKYYYSRSEPVFCICETMDPVNPGNNTTKGAYRLSDVQDLFRRAHSALQSKAMQSDSLTRLFTQLSTIKTSK